jgi:protein SCO1
VTRGRATLLLMTLCAGAARAEVRPPPAVQKVNVIEHLNEQVPLDAVFTTSEGKPFTLREAFQGGKPVVLTLVYYRCQALCDLVLSGLTRSLTQTGLVLGRDYRGVTVSIDPGETTFHARQRKRGHLQALGHRDDDPSWTFLTGTDPSIRALAESVGFQYTYDEKTSQYAHAAVVFAVTPEGRLSRYLYGMDFSPRDLRLALMEAGGGRVGTTMDRVLLTCFKYDPASRKYVPYMFGFLKGGALLGFFALFTLLWKLWRRELRIKRGAPA